MSWSDIVISGMSDPVGGDSVIVCANVDGARVLSTMEVPRATSDQAGVGSGGAQRFRSSMCT